MSRSYRPDAVLGIIRDGAVLDVYVSFFRVLAPGLNVYVGVVLRANEAFSGACARLKSCKEGKSSLSAVSIG